MKNLSLTHKRRQRLEEQLQQTQDARVFRRTLAILEYDGGTPVSQLARLLRVDRRSIYRWIETYAESSDPQSLLDSQRSGRPPRWTADCSLRLQALLEKSPQEFEFFAANWTIPLLQEQLAFDLGKHFSVDTLRRALRELDYVWKRPRYVLEPDPEREKKTPHPPSNPATGASQRVAGRGRDGPAVVSSTARSLGTSG